MSFTELQQKATLYRAKLTEFLRDKDPWDASVISANYNWAFYDWLVDEYIPRQGNRDMLMFASLNLQATPYYIWKAYQSGRFDKAPFFKAAIRAKVKSVFGVDFDESEEK